MKISASKIPGLNIVSSRDDITVGRSGEPILDPVSMKIIAIHTSKSFFTGGKIIAYSDVVGFETNAVLIDSTDSLIEVDDIVRVKRILDEKIRIINSKVYTESKQYLGSVKDYVIDTVGGELDIIIIKSFIRSLTKSDLTISKDLIVRIEKNKITVKDASIKVGIRKALGLGPISQ